MDMYDSLRIPNRSSYAEGPFLWRPGTSEPLVCVWGGAGTSEPLVCGGEGAGWHECTICVCGGGAYTSVLFVCGGVALSHHCLTAAVDRGQFRLCRFHDVLA